MHPAFERIGRCVRPLLIDSGLEAAPLGIWGTCILAMLGNQCAVITARHLIRHNHSGELRILISAQSAKRLPLSQGVGKADGGNGNEVDVVVYPASLAGLGRREVERSQFIRLDALSRDHWLESAAVAKFFVVGFPRDLSEIDYEDQMVRTHQLTMPATYQAAYGGTRHMHTLRIDDGLGLKDFAGLSGGAVFSFERQVGSLSECRFCGVVVEGTAESRLVHFVDAWHVLHIVRDASDYVMQFGMKLTRKKSKFEP